MRTDNFHIFNKLKFHDISVRADAVHPDSQVKLMICIQRAFCNLGKEALYPKPEGAERIHLCRCGGRVSLRRVAP